ncbi:MAG: EpsI family protein [Proteobacteria bacterium]|nr:EpsI family protein [Pseudomonadota bacterium]
MSNKTFLFSLLILILTVVMIGCLSVRQVPVVVQTNLEKLPREIGGYSAIDGTFPESVYKELNSDKNIYRHYRNGNGDLSLYIGYYGTAKGGRTGHNPYACLPGAGWSIMETKMVNVGTKDSTSSTRLNYIRARRDGVNTVMVHWYQTGGTTVVATGIRQNIERFRGRLLHNRNDGAFVQITAQVQDEEVESTLRKIKDFSGQVIELLPKYWPVEE